MSIDRKMATLWYIHTLEYYTAINRKELLVYAVKWVNFKHIVLSKISYTHKNIHFMIPLT